MLRFDASSFALIGVIASAVPIVIHLWNRHRFKTVSWAAMDFIREALEHQRKRLHIRDVLLLACRMLAVILLGLVLSQPRLEGLSRGTIWPIVLLILSVLLVVGLAVAWATSPSKRGRGMLVGFCGAMLALVFQLSCVVRHDSDAGETAANSRTPLHAVIVVDNSRSMGVESFGGMLLDRAKMKAAEFIDKLPLESRVTVIPLAGSEDPVTLDAYRNKEDSLRAVDRVKLVDVEAGIRSGLELVELACQQTVDPPSKRIVLLTDGQANAWRGLIPDSSRGQRNHENGNSALVESKLIPDAAASLPSTRPPIPRLQGMQVVNVTRSPARNVWVSGFHVEDGLTSSDVPCRFQVRIHSAVADRAKNASSVEDAVDVQAKLLVDEVEVAGQTISLMPGQEREVELSHQFTVRVDPLKPSSVVATLLVQADLPSADQLSGDNRQQIVVPVVASLPVIFVDQYGDDENLEQNRIGETYALRHLMVPRSVTDQSPRRLIDIKHLRSEQLTQELLETARLVVVAGVEKPPSDAVTLLREFVRQGGPLVILAGGHFDAMAWTEQAWRSGQGILPAPLGPTPLGHTPEETTQPLQPFFAAFSSMQHDFFLIDGEDPQVLASLFESTPFFKAVQIDFNETFLAALRKEDANRLSEEKRFLDDYAAQHVPRYQKMTAGLASDEAERIYREIEPAWWNWRSPLPLVDRALDPETLAKQSQPRVLASFDAHHRPFVIERRVGAGRVVFLTSGVTSNWNLLRSSGAMYLFHRMFCQLMEQTFPNRNFVAGQKIALPVEGRDDRRYAATRPSGITEPLRVDVMSATVSGVAIRRPVMAGTYTVVIEQTDASSPDPSPTKIDEIVLAVNGAESESDLTAYSVQELQSRLEDQGVRVLGADEALRIDGVARSGGELWQRLGWCLLGSLLLEQLILAWPRLRIWRQV